MHQQFPENNGLVRELRADELSTDDGTVWGVVAYLEPSMFPSLDASGGSYRVVPDAWDEVLLANGGLGPVPPGPAPLVDEPGPIGGDPACTLDPPLPNTFCPYDATESAYLDAAFPPGWSCNESLEDQMLGGDARHPPIMGEDYYEVVDLGSSWEGRTIRGVRLGRLHDPGDPEPTPEIVLLAGQHPNEWGPIEFARRLLFRLADDLRDGDPEAVEAFGRATLLVVPVGNPDGYDRSHNEFRARLSSRTNTQGCPSGDFGRVGVDLNRNNPFGWGLNEDGSSGRCPDDSYRGEAPGSAPESQVLRTLAARPGYRTVVVNNLHAFAGQVMATEGFSPGDLDEGASACGDDDNCLAPDLGVFHRLVENGTGSILRNARDPSIPYVTGSAFRDLYQVNGDLNSQLTYEPLVGAAAPITIIIEEDGRCGFEGEKLRPEVLDREVAQYRALILHQLGQLPAMVEGTVPEFQLPVLNRRNVPGRLAAETPTLRVAARNGLTGIGVGSGAGVAGLTEPDDVRPGAYYTMYRWRPVDGGYVLPRLFSVCADEVNCREAAIPAAGDDEVVDLCAADSTFFLRGGAWSWVGDAPGATTRECFHHLTVPGVIGAEATLTSIYYDFSHLSESHLVLDMDFVSFPVTRGVHFDIEVSSNGFEDCSFDNYGNCRIIRRQFFGWDGYRYQPNDEYRTLVSDVSDFDGQGAVQFRIRVFGNGDEPSAMPRFRVYTALPIGWYVP